jgi:hypothetical protein
MKMNNKVNYDEENYKIWFWKTTKDGLKITGRYTKEYKTRGWARRVAEMVYGPHGFAWIVSKKNIFHKKCPLCGKEYYVDDAPFTTNSREIRLRGRNNKTLNITTVDICDDCFEILMDMYSLNKEA